MEGTARREVAAPTCGKERGRGRWAQNVMGTVPRRRVTMVIFGSPEGDGPVSPLRVARSTHLGQRASSRTPEGCVLHRGDVRAARVGSGRRRPWGDRVETGFANWHGRRSGISDQSAISGLCSRGLVSCLPSCQGTGCPTLGLPLPRAGGARRATATGGGVSPSSTSPWTRTRRISSSSGPPWSRRRRPAATARR